MLRNQTNARKRRKVINEIFATEKTYQDHLHAVTSVSIHLLHFIVAAFTIMTQTCHLWKCQIIKACETIHSTLFATKEKKMYNFKLSASLQQFLDDRFMNS